MAADGKAFGIALAFDILFGAICLTIWAILRTKKWSRKYYCPKRYRKDIKRPKRLPNSLFGWISIVWNYTEDEVIEDAGLDAQMYLRIIKFGVELFGFVTLWCLVVCLPVNVTDNYIDQLTNTPVVSSPYTYWVPPPGPPNATAPPPPPITTPDFYEPTPPAPPGLMWWRYNSSVPPLQNPGTVLGPSFADYGWRYDSSFTQTKYQFSNLDHTTLSNVQPKSARLIVHVLTTWLVSLWCLYLLRRYNVETVELRIRYLSGLPRGAESHTCLVQDIPGVPFGRVVDRADDTFLAPCPGFLKSKMKTSIAAGAGAVKKTANATVLKTLHTTTGAEEAGDKQGELPDEEFVDATETRSETGSRDSFTSAHSDPLPPVGAVTGANAWHQAEEELKFKSTTQLVEQEYADLFPGQVAAVNMVHDTTKLDPLVNNYTKSHDALQDILDDYIYKKRSRKPIKKRRTVTAIGAKLGDWGKEKYGLKPKKVDALEYYPEYMEYLKGEIKEAQAEALHKDTPCAFVTFNSRRAQTMASTTLLNADRSAWITSEAPGTQEIYWPNVRWRAWERQWRNNVIWLAFAALAIFYLIPIAAVQAIASIKFLKNIVVFHQLVDFPLTNALLAAILPGLVLKIFLALLPALLAFMNKLAGYQSASQIDFGVASKFFIFQVISVFFGSFIVGTFFSQITQWLKNPSSAVNLIGTAVPLTSIFFMSYMAIQAFASNPGSQLNIVGLVIYYIKGALASTEAAKQRLWADQTPSYGADVPNHTIAILFGLVYCCISPIITPIILCYFVIILPLAKYQAIYVWNPVYESGGMLWRTMHQQVLTGLMLFQIIMIFILAIKKAIWAPILCVPLPFISYFFAATIKERFALPQTILSYRGATDADHKDERELEQHPDRAPDPAKIAELYLNPVFIFDDAEHERLLGYTKTVNQVLNGEMEPADTEGSHTEVDSDTEEKDIKPVQPAALPK